jgi:penicillin amidase
VTLDVVETRNGPIFLEQDGKRYALRWTALDPKNSEFEAFYFLNRAKDWTGFKNALKTYGGATQNFVYADVKGNIGWYAAGRIPTRKVGDGSMPYDGSTNDGEWIGNIPFEELPSLYNPAEGFIVTANQRIVGTSYKYTQMSRDASSPWRARRIYDLLKPNTKVTMDDVAAVQLDSYNIPVANLAKQIVAQNAASAETLMLLKSWDGRMTPDSKAALITNEIRLCLANKIADENKPASATIIRERLLDWVIQKRSARWLPKTFADYPAFLKACDTEATTTLAKRYPDASKLVWGSASMSRFPHPLAAAPLIGGQFATPNVPIAGSGQTPNVGSFVSMRHIASPGNWDATRHVIPLGQSGDPKSPHYKDQFDLWRTGAPAVFPFSREAVSRAAVDTTEFRPN